MSPVLRFASTLLVLVVVSGCAPQLAFTRTVPPRVMLGAEVRAVTVSAEGPAPGQVLDPAAVSRAFVLAPVAVEHLERRLATERIVGVLRACPVPCPGAQANVLVRVAQQALKPLVEPTKSSFGEPNEASVTLHAWVQRADGYLLFEGDFAGAAKGELDKRVSDDELFRRATVQAADRFVGALRSRDTTDHFVVKQTKELEAGNQLLLDGAPAKAAELFRVVTQQSPQNADAWYSLGVALLLADDLDGADAAFRQAAGMKWEYQHLADYVSSLRADEAAVSRSGR